VNMKFLLLFVVLIFVVDAQRCGHDEYMEVQYKIDPSLRGRLEQQERLSSIAAREELSEVRQQTVYSVRTVVHIVYNTAAQNYSDALIFDQIARTNIDFRRLNGYTATVNPFKELAADIGIQLVLATTDPNGNPTNGITRTLTNKTSFNFPTQANPNDACKTAALGGIDSWDTTQYLNIWVCVLNTDTVVGYARSPGYNSPTDGMVIATKAFTRFGRPPYQFGRTLTHEAGHWFNLKHPWGDQRDECSEDDLVADTPAEYGPAYGCQLDRSTCGNLNMVQNFMDYSDDNCMTLFTAGQAARARSGLSLYRAGVIIPNYNGTALGLNGTYVSPYPNSVNYNAASQMAVFYGLVCFIALFFL